MKYDTKQVIIIRKDLNMRKGKLAAQAAHASMKIFFDRMDSPNDDLDYRLIATSEMKSWIQGSFAKIVVYVNSEFEICDLQQKAGKINLPTALIIDEGRTEFHGVPTVTALAIGPGRSDLIDTITGGLPLL